MQSNIAANIRHFRSIRGWTQDELAARIGAHRTVVARLETKSKAPSPTTLVRLADALGVTVDALVRSSNAERRTR